MPNSLVLWRDRRGRLSWLRVATLAVLVWPVALVAAAAARGGLGGRPLNEVIHRTGWWALVFLLASLAISPLRRTARFAKLVDVRRMVGVAAFVYAAVHLGLYVADQGFDVVKVAVEIVSRLYLTIGFVALLGLLVLAATSNDTMVKRLGGLRWRRIHQAAYAVTVLSLVHFFQQTKADVSLPTLYAGLFAWLMGYRLLGRLRGEDELGPVSLVLLSLVVAALTFLGEGIGIATAFKLPLGDFLLQYAATILDTSLGVRPGWWVLGAGLMVAALDALRNRIGPIGRVGPGETARARAAVPR